MWPSHKLSRTIIFIDWNCYWHKNSKIEVINSHQCFTICTLIRQRVYISVPVLIFTPSFRLYYTSVRCKSIFQCFIHDFHQFWILHDLVRTEHSLIEASCKIISTLPSLHYQITSLCPVLWSCWYSAFLKIACFFFALFYHVVRLAFNYFVIFLERFNFYLAKDVVDNSEASSLQLIEVLVKCEWGCLTEATSAHKSGARFCKPLLCKSRYKHFYSQ